MTNKKQFVVFITGCSTGIGRALAEEFIELGHRVVATARKPEAIGDLQSEGATVLSLDVTNGESISNAVAEAERIEGRIDILINNAGFGLMGPLAELKIEDLRRQYETNVVGPISLVKAVIPGMIARGEGRIANIGSVSGILATPFAGAYCSSKFAIGALSDVLRVELAPFGIHVTLVQPGAIESKFGETALKTTESVLSEGSIYAPVNDKIAERAMEGQQGAMPAKAFARRVAAALTKSAPPPIVRAGKNSTMMPIMKRVLPQSAIDSILTKRFGLGALRRGK